MTLTKLVQSRGLTAKNVYRKLGYQVIGSWRLVACGVRSMPERKLRRLAQVLGVTFAKVQAAEAATARRYRKRKASK